MVGNVRKRLGGRVCVQLGHFLSSRRCRRSGRNRCPLAVEFLTPPYGFAYNRAKQIGVVTRNESVRIRQSRPVANGCQEPALATLAAVSGGKGMRTVNLFSGALRRSDARRSVGNAVEIRNSAWIGVGVLTRLGDAAGTLVAEFGQNSAKSDW